MKKHVLHKALFILLFLLVFFPGGAASFSALQSLAFENKTKPEKSPSIKVDQKGKIEQNRSPVDLVLSRSEKWLATVNQTSDSVSLVGLAEKRVLDEITVGRHPSGIALGPDDRTILVSCAYSGEVFVLETDGQSLEKLAAIHVGYHPHGVAIAPDGNLAYVALSASAQVAVLDLKTRKIAARIDVGQWPRYVALSPDGSKLAVGTGGDRGVSVVDTSTGKMQFQEKFLGLNIGHIKVSKNGLKAYFPWVVYRHNPITVNNIRQGWVLATRIGRVRLDGPARREAISLDPRGRAVADPFGLDLTNDEQTMVVSAAGTQELLVYQLPGLPFKDYGGADHIDPQLLADRNRFFRIPLEGRPLGLQIAADNRTVYVANYLSNTVQIVDLEERRFTDSIPLGGPLQASLARRGEAIFYDAKRSLDQWYSCATCHLDGGVNAERMDTMNDDTAFTFKTVPSLYNVSKTPPWTWHGRQTNLRAAMHKSITSTLKGPPLKDEEVDALLAYLKSLRAPPNPFLGRDGSMSQAAKRGKLLFESEKAACANCHNGPHFTDGLIHDVGLGKDQDKYKGFNTPSLIGLYGKVRLLHDGRARSIEALLTKHHSPEKVSKSENFTKQELQDLIEYLKTL